MVTNEYHLLLFRNHTVSTTVASTILSGTHLTPVKLARPPAALGFQPEYAYLVCPMTVERDRPHAWKCCHSLIPIPTLLLLAAYIHPKYVVADIRLHHQDYVSWWNPT